LDVIGGVTPIAAGVEIAQAQLLRLAAFDAGDAVADLAGDEF
jgi:hypothetical protein